MKKGNPIQNRVRNTGIERSPTLLARTKELEIRNRVDHFLDDKISQWYAEVPGAHLLEDKTLNKDYYRRHLLETAWRIRLLRVVESKAIAEIAKLSPQSAQAWARYEMEEMLHDEMFLDDLESLGIKKSEALKTEPYLSTKLLAGYFSYLLEHEGPLGVIAYSYMVEYVNVKLDPKKVASLENTIGTDKVKGYATHTKTDAVEDHPGEVWAALRYFLQSEDDVQKLLTYINEHQKILAQYFTEIYQEFYK
jgi:hypothetical protein